MAKVQIKFQFTKLYSDFFTKMLKFVDFRQAIVEQICLLR